MIDNRMILASLVQVFIDIVEAFSLGAIHFVPPIAHQIALIKQGSHRAEEWVRATGGLTHVKDLEERNNLATLKTGLI